MSRPTPLTARTIALLFAATLAAAAADATELCRTRRKALVVRDQCKSSEAPVTAAQQVALGLEGPQGQAGTPGPSTGDLTLVDANGAEVGLVLDLRAYYGAAHVIRSMTIPGSSGPEFVRLSATASGLLDVGGCPANLYENATCAGAAYSDCRSGECSSADGAFFFRDIFGGGPGGACVMGSPSQVRRGDFFRRQRIGASTPEQAGSICEQSFHGTLVAPSEACQPNRFCFECCRAAPQLGAIPAHPFDPALIGSPPFKLSK